jgi:hypothetical protein
VRGWHDASNSGIYSNEVKDTRADVLLVKAFKGGTLAEGALQGDQGSRQPRSAGSSSPTATSRSSTMARWHRVAAVEGRGAQRVDGLLKSHRADLYKKAIRINGFTEGKKGRVTFRVPVLKTADISADTDAAATALDRELQEFLKGYLAKNKREAAETAGRHVSDEEIGGGHFEEPPMEPITDDDIPFAWLLPFLLPAALALHTVLA